MVKMGGRSVKGWWWWGGGLLVPTKGYLRVTTEKCVIYGLKTLSPFYHFLMFFLLLLLFVYLSSLLVAHLSDAHRRWLVVTGDSARIQDETTERLVL